MDMDNSDQESAALEEKQTSTLNNEGNSISDASASSVTAPDVNMDVEEKISKMSHVQKCAENGESSEDKESCSCKCGCQQRLEKLENEVNDLKSWRVGKQQLDDVISAWKDEVESWMKTTFGFILSGPLASSPNNADNDNENPSTVHESRNEDEPSANADIVLDAEDTENVEITPDLFGHFLLDNEYDYGDSDDDIEEIDGDSFDDEEEDESEVPIEKPPKRRRPNDGNIESDSECYTLSSSTSEDITSDDEYEPQRKKGRGRGRGRPPVYDRVTQKSISQGKNSGTQLNNSSGTKTIVDLGNAESRAELLKHCRKRQGNIWECTVCGFMLTSFENMLLHVKYNHSSSAHTCPYCKIVLLCRSPQDAILHQSQCKMKQPNSNNKVPAPKIIVPVQKAVTVPNTTTSTNSSSSKPKPSQKDVHAEIDQFVDDLLGAGSSSSNSKTALPKNNKNNTKKTDSPAIVTLTLSSDDEDDED